MVKIGSVSDPHVEDCCKCVSSEIFVIALATSLCTGRSIVGKQFKRFIFGRDMPVALFILYLLLVLSLIGVVISENRNPIKAMAWVLVITLIPFFGIVVYLLFGQDQRRRRIISRRVYRRLMRRPNYLSGRKRTGRELRSEQMTPIMRLFVSNSDNPVLPACKIDIYENGETKFEALYHDIELAKHHIHIQYYIIDADEYGIRLQQLLIRKAAEGVRVRVIYDHVGSWNTPRSYWLTLRKNGVEAYPYMPVAFPLLTSPVNYRNHRKIVVIDAEIGYIGGMNVARRYASGNDLGPWRDTHFRLVGAAVASLQSSFLVDWYVVSRRVINLDDYYPQISPIVQEAYSEEIPVQVVPGGPIGRWRTIEQGITYLVSRAVHHIYIETPYLLPTDSLNNALITAALAGIHVEVLLPKRSDTKLAQIAGHSYIEDLLRAGVKVRFYHRGFLHSKLLLVDGRVASVGSTNMDFRSLEHNFEINAMIYSEEVCSRLEELYRRDRTYSEAITLDQWLRRGRIERFVESFVRLFSPLL